VLVALAKPLGAFMAKVYQGERTFLSPLFGPIERGIYRLAGVDPAPNRTGSATRSACCCSTCRLRLSCTCCSGCRACCRSIRRVRRDQPGLVVQHGRELRDEH
jgi:hypothetical protein